MIIGTCHDEWAMWGKPSCHGVFLTKIEPYTKFKSRFIEHSKVPGDKRKTVESLKNE